MTTPAHHQPMLTTDLPHLTRLHQGKVRDVYALAPDGRGERVLLVATDRVSAFDVVLPNAVPRKGEVLTRLSQFWYDRTSAVVPSAFVAVLDDENRAARDETRDRFDAHVRSRNEYRPGV